MKVHRELGITQKAAWHLIQCIREVFAPDAVQLDGTIEVDETYMGGGKERNKQESKKLDAGRGAVGKTAVICVKQRSGRVKAQPVQSTDGKTLGGFVNTPVKDGSIVYTDDANAYGNMGDF